MATAQKIKNHFSPSERVLSPAGVKPAKQEFKDDADLNSIMKKFQKTGAIDHVVKHQGSYGISTPVLLHEAMNLVTAADSMFADLPSSLRNKFENKPAAFLEYVQDPKNAEEAKKLGLALTPEATIEAEAIAKKLAEETDIIAPPIIPVTTNVPPAPTLPTSVIPPPQQTE